jgi:Protein of unknown function (DUF4232)
MSELRSLLTEVVDEPGGTPAELEAIRTRASRRAARQRWIAALVAVGVALVGIGAASLMFGGHTARPAAQTSQATTLPTPPGSQPSSPGSPSAVPAKPCTAAQLSGATDTAFVQGATQSLAGPITLVNHGSLPCLLVGRPVVRILGPNGELSVKLTTTVPAGPTGTGAIRVAPGKPAVVMLRWTNWCGRHIQLNQIGFMLRISPKQRAFVVGLTNADGHPPVCNQPKYPSTLGVSRWSYPPT